MGAGIHNAVEAKVRVVDTDSRGEGADKRDGDHLHLTSCLRADKKNHNFFAFGVACVTEGSNNTLDNLEADLGGIPSEELHVMENDVGSKVDVNMNQVPLLSYEADYYAILRVHCLPMSESEPSQTPPRILYRM